VVAEFGYVHWFSVPTPAGVHSLPPTSVQALPDPKMLIAMEGVAALKA
jgi:hypothetical protein